jgi:ribosomal silencing factor RsfS
MILVDCGDIVVHVMQPSPRLLQPRGLWQNAASTRA